MFQENTNYLNSPHFINNQKREQFTLGLKRISRETLFRNNRKQQLQTTHTSNLDQVIDQLAKECQQKNRKGIKYNIQQLIDQIQYGNSQQQERIIQICSDILMFTPSEQFSSIHNDVLIILIHYSIQQTIPQSLLQRMDTYVNLLKMYDGQINQNSSKEIIEKALMLIGNICSLQNSIQCFNNSMLMYLIELTMSGYRSNKPQAVWVLNNLLISTSNNQIVKQQLLELISQSALPEYIANYIIRHPEVDVTFYKSILWVFLELSQFIPHEFYHSKIHLEEDIQITIMKLQTQSNLSGQKIIPAQCDPALLIQLYHKTTDVQIKREIIVLFSNLVLLMPIPVNDYRYLLIDSLQHLAVNIFKYHRMMEFIYYLILYK